MTDIVERLRWLQEKTWCGSEHWHRAAADEIEKLREVLKFIVAYSDGHESARDAARQALGEDK